MTVALFVNGARQPFTQWKFPGGEVGIKLEPLPERYGTIQVNVQDVPTSDDIFVAMNLLDALRRAGVSSHVVTLHFNYLPYARQDRVCKEGESFALQVFARMIMSMQHTFSCVTFDDVHSHVAVEQFDQLSSGCTVKNWSQNFFTEYLPEFDVIIAPDHGAVEKAKLTQPGKQHIFLDKVRIDGRVVYQDYAADTIVGEVCIVDDICDGGATFLSAAEMLRKTQPRMQELSLYVTHGLFSKGVDILKEKFDNVYTANPMTTDALMKAICIPF